RRYPKRSETVAARSGLDTYSSGPDRDATCGSNISSETATVDGRHRRYRCRCRRVRSRQKPTFHAGASDLRFFLARHDFHADDESSGLATVSVPLAGRQVRRVFERWRYLFHAGWRTESRELDQGSIAGQYRAGLLTRRRAHRVSFRARRRRDLLDG